MSHPATDLSRGATTIWWIGDPQLEPATVGNRLAPICLAETPHCAFVCVGDLTYGTDAEWTAFLASINGQFSLDWTDTPLFGCVVGNHDLANNGVANWKANLTGQRAQTPAPFIDNYQWAATMAGCRIIAVNVVTAYQERQIEWLRDEIHIAEHWGLWPIVTYHYCVPSMCAVDTTEFGPNVLPFMKIVEDEGVDLVVVGHGHRYERTKAMKDGVPDASGWMQYICGTSNDDQTTAPRDTVIEVDGNPNIDWVIEFDQGNLRAENDPIESMPGSLATLHRMDITQSQLTIRAYHVTAQDELDYLDTLTITR